MLGAALALAACDELIGFADPVTPLAQIKVEVAGTSSADGAAKPNLRVALVWAAQWLPEPFCFLPPQSPAAASVMVAGCRDSLGFVPARVAANAPLTPGKIATLPLLNLPSADTMVGDVTARVAYASLVAYDDKNDNGTLDLQRTRHRHRGSWSSGDAGVVDAGVEDMGAPSKRDVVLGASFVTMAQPDRRLAFREGAFNHSAAYYPRAGCPAPLKGFSVLSAGGFSLLAAQQAALKGELPRVDPATCGASAPEQTVITIALRAPGSLEDVGCRLGRGMHYHDPPDDKPDFTGRAWACVTVPSLGATKAVAQMLVMAGPQGQPCKSLAYYTLKGCDNDPYCKSPEWDRSASPPAWWPCKQAP